MSWEIPKIWTGGDVWIIGGGPSIVTEFQIPNKAVMQVRDKRQPLSVYSPYMKAIHFKHIIGINIAFQLGNWVDMVFFGDDGFFKRHEIELRSFSGLKISCTAKVQKDPSIKYVVKDRKKPSGITDNPSAISWNRNSGAAAISLAVNAGAKRIFLLGFDMKLDAGGNQHWHNVYKAQNRKAKTVPFKAHLKGFVQIAIDAQKKGVTILNVSPSSNILEFEKISLEAALFLTKKDNTKEVEKMYQRYCNETLQFRSGDISEHLPTLREYASKSNHVTEMGVRDGASTIAIGAGKPKTMRSYDIVERGRMKKVETLLEESKIDFKFILGDVLESKIEETDMLFIDTLHTYNQLSLELELHQSKVKKYIILHDTTSFGEKDERIYAHASYVVKAMQFKKAGLMTAVKDFLKRNKNWCIEKQYTNNNGLTILKRVK